MKKHPAIDRLHEEAFEAWEAGGTGQLRRLRDGEWVPVPELDLPDARISGPGLSVVEYQDGRLSPVIPDPAGLTSAIMWGLVCAINRPLSGPEAAFIRRRLGLTQAELAQTLGIRRESLSKDEKKARLPRDRAIAIRFIGMISLINELPVRERAKHINDLANLQDSLSKNHEGTEDSGPLLIPVPGSNGESKIELPTACCGRV